MANDGIRYLERVAVRDKDTWFSIHHIYRFPDPDRDPIFPGTAHQSVRTAWRDVTYWYNQGTDIYLAQGAFTEAGEKGVGPYPKAKRLRSNLAGCKNLYMDIDVKPGAYATREDAIRSIVDMVRWAKIPAPTIIVASGSGGIHVYWTLNEIFDQKIFSRMAGSLIKIARDMGMHFDPQCTNDRIRLLRVPWTWNYKTPDDPKLVELIYDDGKDIDLNDMQAALFAVAPLSGSSQSYSSPGGQASSEFDDNDDLTGGMDHNFAPANIDEVAAVCPFIKDTLADGGAKLDGEPQWHIVAALSAHCVEPSATFHRLCSGNQFYVREDADAKLEGVQHAHERDRLGPHLCETIRALGIPHCNTCPHLSLNTTPLSVSFKRTNGHAYLPPVNSAPNSNDLPAPYYRDTADQLIYLPRPNAEDTTPICVFEHQIVPDTVFLEEGAPFKFHLTTYQGEQFVAKTFDATAVADTTALGRALTGMGLAVTGDIKHTKAFFMSYTALLASKRGTTVILPPFGWAADSQNKMGFSYSGEFVSPNGKLRCRAPPTNLSDYTQVGDPAIWRDLASIILTPDRPDIAMIASRAFGAPLVTLTGETGVLTGVFSALSGIGKSTAALLGQAVYSRPVLMGLTDTNSYVFSRAGDLKHLPLYYDEIRGDEQIEAFCKIVFQLTGGKEKGRSGRTGQAREIKTFETSVDYTSNKSMVAEIRERDKGTDASWYRVYEVEGLGNPVNDEAFEAEVGRQVGFLRSNYGWIGREYATFLGTHQDYILKQQAYVQERLKRAVAPRRDERFWAAAVTTSYLGANLAVALGFCRFPLKEMWDFMVAEYLRMRAEMAGSSGSLSNEATIVDILAAFLNDKRTKNMLILDRTVSRGFAQAPEVLNLPKRTGSEDHWGPFEVQISGDPMVVRIFDKSLTRWCNQYKHSKAGISNGIKKLLNGRMTTITIGYGTSFPNVRENGWEIIVQPGSPLEPALEEYKLSYAFKP